MLTDQEASVGKSVDQILRDNGIDSEPDTPEERTPQSPYQDEMDADRITTAIGRHVTHCWQRASQAKERHQGTLMKCLRQREGKYDPEILQAIKDQGGSEIYMLLTQLKVRSAKAWIKEIMLGSQGRPPFGVNPTPIPDLPPDVRRKIKANLKTELDQAIQAGLYPTEEKVRKRVMKVASDVMKSATQYAKKKSERMHLYLEDQMIQADWLDAFDAFLDDFLTYPVAFMKGPFNQIEAEMAWMQDVDGQMKPQVRDSAKRKFSCVSPFDAYPAPNARNIQEGYFIERMRLRRDQLYRMIGLKGYDEQAIRQIIQEYGDSGFKLRVHRDEERNQLEGRDWDHFSNDNTMDCINFWGKCRGKWLVEWGVPRESIPDLDADYEANVMMVGPHVFRAVLNPDPLGKRPYIDASLERANNTIFNGKGLAQIIRDVQEMCNAAARSLSNNMALSSGPMVEIMVDRLAPGENVTDMYPWRQFQTTESKVGSGSGSRAINFFQPNSNANELMAVFKFYTQLADEYSGIPPYTMGSNPSGGAASTASGLGMLIEGAARGIKLAVSELDKVTVFNVQQLFSQVMLYDDVPEIKGDIKIFATGTKGVLNREQSNMRRMELLQIISQPQMLETVGPEPMVEALREMYEGFQLDPSKLPSPDDMANRLMQASQQAQQGPQPSRGREMTNDGRPAGGADMR